MHYKKKDGWVYMTNEEARSRGFYSKSPFPFRGLPKQLEDQGFNVTWREDFQVGDPVCWLGMNGEVVRNKLSYPHPIAVLFQKDGINVPRRFTMNGRDLDSHSVRSLLHGHDVTREEDEQLPVTVKLKAKKKTGKEMADEIRECLPHWIENLRLAEEGMKLEMKIGSKDCPLCQRYYTPGPNCAGCPLLLFSRHHDCDYQAYKKVVESRTPESVAAMISYLYEAISYFEN